MRNLGSALSRVPRSGFRDYAPPVTGSRRRVPNALNPDPQEARLTFSRSTHGRFYLYLGWTRDRPARVLYCLGLRAEESTDRANQPPLMINQSWSSSIRTITRWLPIHTWSIRDVWEQIKAAGLQPHAAYSWRLGRLSCAICIMGSLDDLMLAGALLGGLLEDYRLAEAEIGHRFTLAVSIGEIAAALATARAEAAGDPAAPDLALALYEMVRQWIASTPIARGEGVTKKGHPCEPWPEHKVSGRAEAQTIRLLQAARRALVLAADVDVDVSHYVAPPVDDAMLEMLCAD
ncbi:phosphoadenosine phosphosulfate reductase family protein [Nonomuraea sp. NPDC050202]|uniref:phosphoadenosine phosphosulfate reductase domain-containing protein n=1 Tax=Nonomuraea sp. NPDC050202 TaxID=3155035 RepID=UPI003401D0E2